jgi:hypothetical protein
VCTRNYTCSLTSREEKHGEEEVGGSLGAVRGIVGGNQEGKNAGRGRFGRKEAQDDIWLVSFMDYDLGYFDLETRVLEPLENPLGLKV